MLRLGVIIIFAALMMACSPSAPSSDNAPPEAVQQALPDEAEPNQAVAAVIAGDEAAPAAPVWDYSGLDERLFGTWINENNINSDGGAGGFASFATVMTMELRSDGTVKQYTQSVGGGADWSTDSGVSVDFEGQWAADGKTLYVKGMGLTGFTPAATYSFSDQYLVTQSDLGRLIWQRSQ